MLDCRLHHALGIRLCVSLLTAIVAAAAWADSLYPRRPISPGFSVEVLAQAQPDEYYYGLGDPRNAYTPGWIDPAMCYTDGDNLPRPKVNDAYIWGMAKAGNTLYLGTIANASILVAGNYFGYMDPAEKFMQASEYQTGIYGQTNGLPADYADWRPPRIYRFDIGTRTLTRVDLSLPSAAQADLHTLRGIRAGGAVPPTSANPRGLVVMAGPPLRQDKVGGVGLFFFDGTDGTFLGSLIKPEYTNLRRFVTLNGDLYAGVQTAGDGYGRVIRIVNNRRNPRFPFVVEEVGELDQAGADIAVHGGRLFITTWPGYLIEGGSTNGLNSPIDLLQRASGLWMSPTVPSAGLTSLHRRQWVKVWNMAQYEPNVLVSATCGGGAISSFDGWLYFGTMHIPTMAAKMFSQVHPAAPAPPAGTPEFDAWAASQAAIYEKTERVISLFRGRNFFKPRSVLGIATEIGGEVQLLVGYRTMPVYSKDTDSWTDTTNRMNQVPLMSGPGYGAYNCYTWCMTIFKHNLYIGTLNADLGGHDEAFYRAEFARQDTAYGADLLMIPSSLATNFTVVSRNGLGNPLNFGIRNMIATDDEIFVGTANANNLMAEFDDGMPDGGWELLRLTKRDPTPFDVDGDYAADPAWVLPSGATVALGSDGPTTNRCSGMARSRSAWADYDGDGRTDPGWFTPADGRWRACYSTRAGVLATVAATPGAPSGAIPVPADFDGDGKADPAWFNPLNGALAWQSASNPRSCGRTTGPRDALPAVADYDGDRRADLAWFAAPRGEWTILLSSGGRRVLQTAPDGVPVPADYDGDGRADLAVHTPLGEIRVLRHSGGSPAFTTDEHLGNTWMPMPGDYDGDGRADFAWYQAASMTLHIRFADGTVNEYSVPEVGSARARPAATPAAVDGH
jgi:hypothetical protein